MASPLHYRVLPDHAEFCPVGEMTLAELTRMITAAIHHAREEQHRNLLINVTGATGFKSPSLAERYFLIEEWARAAQAFVRLAMVAPPSMIDPHKFGVTVAANHNQTAEVFSTSAEALAWLHSLP